MHTKRIATGKGKQPKWVVTALAGSHKKQDSMTLLQAVRNVLKYADNAHEAERILHNGLIAVNKKIVREPKTAVGLMDVLEIPKMAAYYRVLPAARGVRLHEIREPESAVKPCRIVDKQTLKGGRVQLNLHDGTTILLNKGTFKTKDTLVLELPSRNIRDVLEYKTGAMALISRGRHSGKTGLIGVISAGGASVKSKTKVGDFETLSDYVFVIGKEKPVIST
jgi:small subunit ribosomal protein S4e